MNDGEIDMPALGEAIRRRREASHLSIRQLAKRTGMAGSYLGEIEQGQTSRPGIVKLANIAFGLGVPLGELIQEAGLPAVVNESVELQGLYDGLDSVARWALKENAATLREVQARYGEQGDDEEEGDGSDAPPDDPDAPPSFHPPGTLGHIFTPAADSGEDLKRAENRRRYDEEQRRKRQAEHDDS